MLKLIFKYGDFLEQHSYLKVKWQDIQQIIAIEVSGPELQKVFNLTSGIPTCYKPNPEAEGTPTVTKPDVCYWFGDDAKFIVANLFGEKPN